MSLFRDLNRATIEANVGKNAYKVFLALLEQTLGYGKSTDRLTDNRLAYLSKVRIDRFRPAVQAILACGVFEQTPAKKFQFRYTIGQSFLEKYPDLEFYTPALPKKRADSQKTEQISEKERHTALDLNTSLSSFLQPLQTLIQSSTDMMQQQMQQQNQWIDILLQAQMNQNNLSQATTPPAETTHPTTHPTTHAKTAADLDAAAFSKAERSNLDSNSNPNININTNPLNSAAVVNIPLYDKQALYRNEDQLGKTRLEIRLKTAPDTTTITAINSSNPCQTLRKTEPNADQNQKCDPNSDHSDQHSTAESRIIHAHNLIHASRIAEELINISEDPDYLPLSQTALAAYAEDSRYSSTSCPSQYDREDDVPIELPEVLPIPKAIAECIPVEDYPECNTLLSTLSAQKQRDVFVVYEDIIQRDGVHYPLPLFKSLVKKATKTGSQGLSVPQGIAKAKARKVSAANKITHPSMVIQTPEVRAERERQERESHDESLRSMLRINSKLAGMNIEDFAEKMLLSHLLPV